MGLRNVFKGTAYAKGSRIIIAGGGTGGHLIPNAVIGKLINHQIPNTTTIHIVGNTPLDQEILGHFNVTHVVALKSRPFASLGVWAKCKGLLRTLKNTFICMRHFLKHRPQAIIGVGGYVSFSAVVAAWILRIPVFLQEQNRIPGLANRVLGHIAHTIFAGFSDTQQFFGSARIAGKCTYSGNFNRARLSEGVVLERKPALDDRTTLLICGGSQGALALNNAVLEILPDLFKCFPDLNIVWQCGRAWVDTFKAKTSDNPFKSHINLLGFEPDLLDFYKTADLSLSRSGALSIADVISSTTPTVFVPFPHAAGNHQVKNAQWLVEQNAAAMVEQKDGWIPTLAESLKRFLANEPLRHETKQQLQKIRKTTPSTKTFISNLSQFLTPR